VGCPVPFPITIRMRRKEDLEDTRSLLCRPGTMTPSEPAPFGPVQTSTASSRAGHELTPNEHMEQIAQQLLDSINGDTDYVMVSRKEYDDLKARVEELSNHVGLLSSVDGIRLNSIEILHSRLELIGLFAPGSSARSGAPFRNAEEMLAAAHYYCAAFFGRTMPPQPDEGAFLAEYWQRAEARKAAKAAAQKAELLKAFEDEPAPALTDFDLRTKDGRLGFLWALFHHHYCHGLLQAVNVVWASLARPKAVRCQIMAQQLKLPGTGKKALKNVLAVFLEETLYGVEFPPCPNLANYADSADGHAAWHKHFADIDAKFDAIVERYEAILDGRDPRSPECSANVRSNILPNVIEGPWVAGLPKGTPL
jgi:hypothetical protein